MVLPTRSKIWAYYKVLDHETAGCMFCGKRFIYDITVPQSVDKMFKHLKVSHPNKYIDDNTAVNKEIEHVVHTRSKTAVNKKSEHVVNTRSKTGVNKKNITGVNQKNVTDVKKKNITGVNRKSKIAMKKKKKKKKNNNAKKLKSIITKKSTNHAPHKNSMELDNNTETLCTKTSYEIEIEEEKPFLTQTSTAASTAVARLPSYSDNKNSKISDAILSFICTDNQPPNIIQYKGFKHLMKKMAPSYKIPNTEVIKSRLDERYNAITRIFQQKLTKTSHVTITIDVWSDTVRFKSYMGVAVHFVMTGSRKLESRNIEVIELLQHTGSYIAHALQRTLKKWNIDMNKVVAVVTNYESNIFSAVVQIFGEERHVACFAHSINMVAENSIKSEGLAGIVRKVRSIVRYVKGSVCASHNLCQRQIDIGIPEDETKTLILDSEIGWYTTVHMTRQFLELCSVIDEILPREIFDRPTVDELIALKECLDLFEPLEFVAQECTAEGYVVISKVIPLISCALAEYERITQTTELSARLKQTILAELKKRFGYIEFMNSISFATILDPRFKTMHFRDAQALAKATHLLRETVNKLSDARKSDIERKRGKYDLWNHHRLLMYKPKGEMNAMPSSEDELSLYLASPLANLRDNPLGKWEDMKMMYPTLYNLAIKYLTIVVTSVQADRLFSKAGVAINQARSRLTGKELQKLLFLNSVDQEYDIR